METLSAYARQFLDQMERPDVDAIDGLSPSISIEQKTTSRSPRSTVGTITEIYDYLRLLYASIGVPHCPKCGRPITRQSAEQIVQRVSEATDGAFAPPQEIVELAIGKLAGRGFVSVDDGVATLTELGRNVLQWKGISSESIHARLAQAGKFKDVAKIRWGLVELVGLARTIHWSGTDAQKEKLAEARTKLLTAITEAKQSLHAALAES